MRRHCIAIMSFAIGLVSTPVMAGAIDEFTIGLEELIDVDVPGPGAGNIEAPGNQDVYTFSIDAPTSVFFDFLRSSQFGMQWKLEDPDGATLFSGFFGDVGPLDLDLPGDYTLTAFANGDATGTYSFTTWVPEDDFFDIGLEEFIEVDVPGPGAGNIEEPGNRDVYTLAIDEPTTVFFDFLGSSAFGLRWSLEDPDGTTLFDAFVGDVGAFDLDLIGDYVLTVRGNGDNTATYSFTTWVPADDFFSIELEELVEIDVPGAGAGNIEIPGNRDIYTLAVNEPTTVFFDFIGSSAFGLIWSLHDPDGTELFEVFVGDVGPIELEIVGDYVVTVRGNGDNTATYSFTTWLPFDDSFDIALGDLVDVDMPGPGAGDIEQPGNRDFYTFANVGTTSVLFDFLESSAFGLRWSLTDPDGNEIFEAFVADVGPVLLELDGDYLITVRGNGDNTATYSFTTFATGVDFFDIELEELVEVDVPGPGAGNIEQPGDEDIYTLSVPAPASAFFDFLESSAFGLVWTLEDPDGTEIFSGFVSDEGPLDLDVTGDYILTVEGSGDAVATYSFTTWVTNDEFFTIGLEELVDVDDPAAGAGTIEEPGDTDVYTLVIDEPVEACFDQLAATDNFQWTLTAPDGAELFDGSMNNVGNVVLAEAGDYTLVVRGLGDANGTYSFIVRAAKIADLNRDCTVDGSDLGLLLASWGRCGDDCFADLNGDGEVNGADLGILLGEWG